MRKSKCSVCKKTQHTKKVETLIGRLGIIPVQFCKNHLKKILNMEEMNLSDTRTVKMTNG